MTRMLCSILACLFIVLFIGGCSLFSDEETTPVSEVDTESVSGGELADGGLLDTEDEMLAESSDLLEGGGGESATEPLDDLGFDEASADAELNSMDSLDSEFEAAQLGDGGAVAAVGAGDEGFSDDDFGADFGEDSFGDEDFGDDAFSTSGTDEFQVDQKLAEGELSEFDDANFSDSDFGAEGDELAFDGQPMEDPLDPVVDTPVVGDLDSPAPGAVQITNLSYKAFENGGTVVIETSAPTTFEKINDPTLNQVVIEVQNAFLPARFKRPYITKDFKQDIATINAYSDPSGAARFVIQLKRPMDPTVQQEGNSILVMTREGDMPVVAATGEQPLDALVAENQMEFTVKPDGTKVASNLGTIGGETSAAAGGTTTSSSVFETNEKSGLSLTDGKFVGEKISLEFVDHDIRDIIEVIAEKSGVNLIMDKEVHGTTSIRLRNIPWDQALLVLLRSQSLGYVKQGTVLRIAKQKTLSSEAQAVSNQIKSEKEARLLSGGIKVKYIPVSYADVKDLSSKLKDFTSKDGKVAFDDRTSSLVITDYGEYIERIIELVKALDTPPMQVEIESKLIEAREEFSREAGINWNISGQDFPVGSQSGNVAAVFGRDDPTDGLTLDMDVGTFDIFGDLGASLKLFEAQNKIKVLSQPRVVTMNKVKAEIVQNTQIPFDQIIQNPGSPPVITPSFQDLQLSLNVTPQITFKGDVILDVEMKREFAGAQASDGRPELNKRRAKTTVMVKNGKTAVIGGIYQLDDRDIDNGIPLLKDIPLLGYLFKQVSVQKSKNELLLFLKPKILKEIEGPKVTQAPTAGVKYDPFEELTVDEGSGSGVKIQTDENEGALDFDDLDETEFSEDSFSL